jgi:hypothetical protein
VHVLVKRSELFVRSCGDTELRPLISRKYSPACQTEPPVSRVMSSEVKILNVNASVIRTLWMFSTKKVLSSGHCNASSTWTAPISGKPMLIYDFMQLYLQFCTELVLVTYCGMFHLIHTVAKVIFTTSFAGTLDTG